MKSSKPNPIVFPIAVGPAIASGIKVAEGLESSCGFLPGLLAGAAFAAVLAAVIAYGMQTVINGVLNPTE